MKTKYSLVPGEKTKAINNLLEIVFNEIEILNKNIQKKIKPRLSKERLEYLNKNLRALSYDNKYHLRNEDTQMFEKIIEFNENIGTDKIIVNRLENFGKIAIIIELEDGSEYLIDYENKARKIETPYFFNSEKKKNTLEIYSGFINSHPKTIHLEYDLFKGVFKTSNTSDFFVGDTLNIGNLGVLIDYKIYDKTINLAHKNKILDGEYLAPYISFNFRNYVIDHYEITTIRIIRGSEDHMIFSSALSLINDANEVFSLYKNENEKQYPYDFYNGNNKIDIESIYPIPFDRQEGESKISYENNQRKFYGDLKFNYGFI
jgi:hypothetical protein